MVDESPSVFTRKAIVNGTLLRYLLNWCKTIAGIDASQLHPYSMCQPLPKGMYIGWELDSESVKFRLRQHKMWSFRNLILSYFQWARPQREVENFYTTGTQKTIDGFAVDGF